MRFLWPLVQIAIAMAIIGLASKWVNAADLTTEYQDELPGRGISGYHHSNHRSNGLHHASIKRKEVMPSEHRTRGPDMKPRPAELSVGAYLQLRYDVIKACWDDVDAFVKWKEGQK